LARAKGLSEAPSLGPLLVRMKAFEVKGQFRLSPREWQPFALEVASTDEKAALDKSLALIGSRHKVKRKFVKIDGVRQLKPDEVTDHTVKYLLGAKK
jgi:large subunit ribosomal protein LX